MLSARYELGLLNTIQKAVPWLKNLVVGFSLQMSGFDPEPFYVRFVGTQWHYDKFSPSTSLSPVSIIYFTCPRKTKGEAWKTSKQKRSFGNRVPLVRILLTCNL